MNIFSFCILFFFATIIHAQKLSIKEYVNTYQKIAIQEMHKSGIPASITLAQGILESASGNSKLSKTANNHFGIKCHSDWSGPKVYHDDDEKNECFRKYKDPISSYIDHSKFLMNKKRYEFLFEYKSTDYKSWAYGLKKAGYATNPKYPELLISLIKENNLYLFDNYKNVIVKNNLINNIPIIYIDKEKSLLSIAKKQKISLSKLKKVNENYFTKGPQPGEHIFLKRKKRKCKHVYHKTKHNETALSIAHFYGIKVKLIAKRNNLKINEPINPGLKIYLNTKSPFINKGLYKSYTVRSGDTLYSISNRYNITIEKLKKLNGLKDNKIFSGMKLRLKD
jgi:LysM repeat protein